MDKIIDYDDPFTRKHLSNDEYYTIIQNMLILSLI